MVLSIAKIQDIFKNIPDSRMGFFLGMESGSDVKFFSPGASRLTSAMRIDEKMRNEA